MRYCDYCGGVGFIKDDCRYCEGTGIVVIDGVDYICGDCDGEGLENETCPVCAGRGYFDDEEDE